MCIIGIFLLLFWIWLYFFRDELQEQLETKIGEYIQDKDELEQDLESKKNEYDSLKKKFDQMVEKLTSTGN